jgi:hypothetical protein
MMGCKPHDPMDVTENAGLYVLAAREIFSKLNGHGKNGKRSNHHQPSVNTSNMCLNVSCFEIYGGKLFDLLNDHAAVKCLEDAKQHVQLLGTYALYSHHFLHCSWFFSVSSRAYLILPSILFPSLSFSFLHFSFFPAPYFSFVFPSIIPLPFHLSSTHSYSFLTHSIIYSLSHTPFSPTL